MKKDNKKGIKKYNIYISVTSETEKRLEFLITSFAQKTSDYNYKYKKYFFLVLLKEYKEFLEQEGIYKEIIFDQNHIIKIYTHKRAGKGKEDAKRNITIGSYDDNSPIILFKNIVYNIQKRLADINDINEAVEVLLSYAESNFESMVRKYKV